MGNVIHIIDDDAAVRESTHALLEAFGYAVGVFGSAEEYLSSSASEPDCLLVDQHMPGMTGFELLEHLRSKGCQTPALMITGRADRDFPDRAAMLEARVFSKPIRMEQLLPIIEAACRR